MDKQEIVAKMTLREKADCLTGGAFFKTRAFPEHGIRDMYLSDGPHGLRKQAEEADHLGLHKSIPSTCFPTASIMACSWDEALGERVGVALGKECASIDVDMLLGPGLNIKRSPLCGRDFEYFAEDPYLAGKMAASFVRGIQSQNVSACVKHFAVNNREYRRMTSNSVLDERTLREIYLTGFEIAVKEGGTHGVMTSYNRLNGVYTNENPHLLLDILRGEWGYKNLVVTDWAGCNSRVEGLKCGNELEMPPCKYGADDLVKAVENGEIPESLLDENIYRILELIEFCDNKQKFPKELDSPERLALLEENHEIAREAAAECLVLLENDGVLPLAKETKVAIVGDFAFNPRYQGAGSSIVNPSKDPDKGEFPTAITALEGLGAQIVAREKGFNRFGKKNKKLYRAAIDGALKADVVLYFAGLDEFSEAEGIDREHIMIPENQKQLFRALVATGKKVVVVLSCGSVVETEWMKDASAVLYAGLSGQAGALAIADVLYGNVNPSGKLAETWVADYADEPTSDPSYFPGGRDTVEYREGLFVGYRYFTTAGVKPRYPFGFGLSYTKFEYSDLTATKEGAKFTVTNTGSVAGDEVAQVYVSKPETNIIRPALELRGFKRVHLEPGESKEVTVSFNDRTFSFFDVKTNSWQIEEGAYTVKVAASSEDVRLEAEVTLDGVVCENELEKFPSYAKGDIKNVPDEEYYALLGYVPEKEEAGKKRIPVHENSTVEDLKHAPGWFGRVFSWAICKAAIGFFKMLGNKAMINTLIMGMVHQPIRGMAKFTGMSRRKMEGLIVMCNGHFFKGFKMFMTKEKAPKQKPEEPAKEA